MRGPVLACSWKVGWKPDESGAGELRQRALLFQPPVRGGRRAHPFEIKFHCQVQCYLLFTQQLTWLNNCLTPGLLAGSPVCSSYLSNRSPRYRSLCWVGCRPSKGAFSFFILKAQQFLGKSDLAKARWRSGIDSESLGMQVWIEVSKSESSNPVDLYLAAY